MCVSVPAKVIEINNNTALVLMGKSRFKVSTSLLENVDVGDYVLIHTGFAIEKISPEAASEMVRLLREIIGSA
jgi:hydrogenase expression/formation protein HypC